MLPCHHGQAWDGDRPARSMEEEEGGRHTSNHELQFWEELCIGSTAQQMPGQTKHLAFREVSPLSLPGADSDTYIPPPADLFLQPRKTNPTPVRTPGAISSWMGQRSRQAGAQRAGVPMARGRESAPSSISLQTTAPGDVQVKQLLSTVQEMDRVQELRSSKSDRIDLKQICSPWEKEGSAALPEGSENRGFPRLLLTFKRKC